MQRPPIIAPTTALGALSDQKPPKTRKHRSKRVKAKPARLGSPEKPRRLPIMVAELRQASREGRKTQTRRVVHPQPPLFNPEPELACFGGAWPPQAAPGAPGFPYGQVGDVCYMPEPLVKVRRVGERGYFAAYADDGAQVMVAGKPLKWRWKVKRLSVRYMPREAARSLFVVEGRRAERLSAITEDAAKAEGVVVDNGSAYIVAGHPQWAHATARGCFETLWDSINGKRDGGKYKVEHDPLVWVLTYRRAG